MTWGFDSNLSLSMNDQDTFLTILISMDFYGFGPDFSHRVKRFLLEDTDTSHQWKSWTGMHTTLFTLKGIQEWFWREQVTHLQWRLYEKVTAPATVDSCWTHITFPRHSVKANTQGCPTKSISCQSIRWTSRFQLLRTLFIRGLAKSLESWELSVRFRQEQNNLGRIDVHMLRVGMAPHLPPC